MSHEIPRAFPFKIRLMKHCFPVGPYTDFVIVEMKSIDFRSRANEDNLPHEISISISGQNSIIGMTGCLIQLKF